MVPPSSLQHHRRLNLSHQGYEEKQCPIVTEVLVRPTLPGKVGTLFFSLVCDYVVKQTYLSSKNVDDHGHCWVGTSRVVALFLQVVFSEERQHHDSHLPNKHTNLERP